MFAFKIKVSVILKMIQWNYLLVKQNCPVRELGTLLDYSSIQQVLILNFAFGPESYCAFQEMDPCFVSNHIKQFIYCAFRQKLKKNWWRSMLITLWVFLLFVSLYFNKSSVIWNIEASLQLKCTMQCFSLLQIKIGKCFNYSTSRTSIIRTHWDLSE